jgi:proteasome lid subunit RPN8/RPN11
MSKPSTVQVSRELLNTILEGARTLHPRENILLLRGKKKKDVIEISELIIPPLAAHGSHFATFASYMLPIDFSIIGTAHSHPSGDLRPSPMDLNHFFGAVLMIVGFPYADENNVSVYRSNGEKLGLHVTSSKAEPC